AVAISGALAFAGLEGAGFASDLFGVVPIVNILSAPCAAYAGLPALVAPTSNRRLPAAVPHGFFCLCYVATASQPSQDTGERLETQADLLLTAAGIAPAPHARHRRHNGDQARINWLPTVAPRSGSYRLT